MANGKQPVMNENMSNSKSSEETNGLGPYEWISIITTLIIIILTTVYFVWRKLRVPRDGILLMGLSDSGKTLIHCRLVHNKYVETVTSTKENVDDLSVRTKTLKLVDVPGHERLRYKFFEDYKATARGIIFIIDSLTIAKDVRDVAEFLYTILSDSTVQSHRVPLFIACNKQDATMTKSKKVIRELLTKEINTVRITKTSQLEGTTEIANTNVYLGKRGKDFDFKDIANSVEFGETSAYKNDKSADLEAIDDWLISIV